MLPVFLFFAGISSILTRTLHGYVYGPIILVTGLFTGVIMFLIDRRAGYMEALQEQYIKNYVSRLQKRAEKLEENKRNKIPD
jgi:hypothetical protein